MSVTGARAVALAGGPTGGGGGPPAGAFGLSAPSRTTGAAARRECRGWPRGPAASVGEDRRGGSVKVRRRTQGKREAGEWRERAVAAAWASVWPWACARYKSGRLTPVACAAGTFATPPSSLTARRGGKKRWGIPGVRACEIGVADWLAAHPLHSGGAFANRNCVVSGLLPFQQTPPSTSSAGLD